MGHRRLKLQNIHDPAEIFSESDNLNVNYSCDVVAVSQTQGQTTWVEKGEVIKLHHPKLLLECS